VASPRARLRISSETFVSEGEARDNALKLREAPASFNRRSTQRNASPRTVLFVYHAAMTALPKHDMTVAGFLAWSEKHEGRFELVRGEIVAMGREAIQHARAKLATANALAAAIERAGVPCEAVIDGPGVIVMDDSFYIPDAIVYCGERLSGDRPFVPNPLIVVEIHSPSTGGYGFNVKSIDYFLVPSIRHYPIVDLKRQIVLHHKRGEGDSIPTEIVRQGDIHLDPRGIVVAVSDLFGGA